MSYFDIETFLSCFQRISEVKVGGFLSKTISIVAGDTSSFPIWLAWNTEKQGKEGHFHLRYLCPVLSLNAWSASRQFPSIVNVNMALNGDHFIVNASLSVQLVCTRIQTKETETRKGRESNSNETSLGFKILFFVSIKFSPGIMTESIPRWPSFLSLFCRFIPLGSLFSIRLWKRKRCRFHFNWNGFKSSHDSWFPEKPSVCFVCNQESSELRQGLWSLD